MKEIIREILNTEDMAQEIVKEARARYRAFDREIDDTRKAIRNELRTESEQEIEAWKQEQADAVETEKIAIRRSAAAKREKMETTFRQKKEAWEAELVQKIIGA